VNLVPITPEPDAAILQIVRHVEVYTDHPTQRWTLCLPCATAVFFSSRLRNLDTFFRTPRSFSSHDKTSESGILDNNQTQPQSAAGCQSLTNATALLKLIFRADINHRATANRLSVLASSSTTPSNHNEG
jgi:hypothetical protein